MSRSGGGAVLSPCPAPGRLLGSGLQASRIKDIEDEIWDQATLKQRLRFLRSISPCAFSLLLIKKKKKKHSFFCETARERGRNVSLARARCLGVCEPHVLLLPVGTDGGCHGP